MANTAVVKARITVPGAAADRANFADAVRVRLQRYTRRAEKLDDTDDTPGLVTANVAFDDAFEADNFLAYLRARLGHTGGPVGQVSFHLCPHAQDEAPSVPCTDPSTQLAFYTE